MSGHNFKQGQPVKIKAKDKIVDVAAWDPGREKYMVITYNDNGFLGERDFVAEEELSNVTGEAFVTHFYRFTNEENDFLRVLYEDHKQDDYITIDRSKLEPEKKGLLYSILQKVEEKQQSEFGRWHCERDQFAQLHHFYDQDKENHEVVHLRRYSIQNILPFKK